MWSVLVTTASGFRPHPLRPYTHPYDATDDRPLYVTDPKAAKGVRELHLSPTLREELTLVRAEVQPEPADYVITTSTRRHNPSNLRRDVLFRAVEDANVKLEEIGIAPIGRIGFHALRRTYASLRCACGEDVPYTADQLGYEDPSFTLRVCASDEAARPAVGSASEAVRPGDQMGPVGHWRCSDGSCVRH